MTHEFRKAGTRRPLAGAKPADDDLQGVRDGADEPAGPKGASGITQDFVVGILRLSGVDPAAAFVAYSAVPKRACESTNSKRFHEL